jgi:hypothetical protein
MIVENLPARRRPGRQPSIALAEATHALLTDPEVVSLNLSPYQLHLLSRRILRMGGAKKFLSLAPDTRAILINLSGFRVGNQKTLIGGGLKGRGYETRKRGIDTQHA